MNTHTAKPIAAVIAALAIAAVTVISARAETADESGSLIYNNRAYIYPIQGAPNPAADRKVQNPEIIYVSLGYGPAIYSYPSNTAFVRTEFNVEYIDTAYGPAIYSYPSNSKHYRLNLVDNLKAWEHKLFTPVSATMNSAPINTNESAF